MTIKELAHAAQRDIQAASGIPFKRSHAYELLAAALGLGSYAALRADHVLDEGAHRSADHAADLELGIFRKALALQLPQPIANTAATILAQAIVSRGICARHLDDLLIGLRFDRGLEDWTALEHPSDGLDEEQAEALPHTPFDNEDCSAVLGEALEAAAAAGDHRALYALSLLHSHDEEEEPEGSAHWYRLQQEGRVLEGVEKEWADAYASNLLKEAYVDAHLARAAELGNPHALLDVAEAQGDAGSFHRAAERGADPVRLASLAYRFDQPNVQHWVTCAAEAGDVPSMRSLVQRFDHQDLLRCWTWVHFAKLLGTDLTKDDMRAYHDGGSHDGQEYDDDIGGPLYADGIEGLDLEALPPAEDLQAQAAATSLFEQLRSRRTRR